MKQQVEIHKSFGGMIPLNPNDERTWRNWNSPIVAPYIQKELTNIGGTIPKGEWAGEPLIKIVWGQEDLSFQKGKLRFTYVDPLNLCVETPRHYLISKDALKRFREFSDKRLKELERVSKSGLVLQSVLVPTNCIPPLTEYLQTYESGLDFERVVRPPELERAGWMYIQDVPEFEWIGEQRFRVVYWTPPELIDTEEAWEANRYGITEIAETGRQEYCDIIGPFPKNGEYRPMIAISKRETIRVYFDDSRAPCDMDYYSYIEPEWNNTVEVVRQAWWEREHRTVQENNRTFLGLMRFRTERERIKILKKKRAEENKLVREDIISHLTTPRSVPTVNLSNVRTKHGKAKRATN